MKNLQFRTYTKPKGTKMQEIWKFLTVLLFGVVLGYILQKRGPEDNNRFVFTLIIALAIGLILFFVGLFSVVKKEETRRLNPPHNKFNQEKSKAKSLAFFVELAIKSYL